MKNKSQETNKGIRPSATLAGEWWRRVGSVCLVLAAITSTAAAADVRLVPRTEWVQLTPTVSPTPRSGMAMEYDMVSGKIVLFGGFGAEGFYLDDTWTFDGVTWTKLAPPVSPPARTAGGMTYDLAIQKLVLFGGFTKSAGYLGDTWLFNGATSSWEETSPSRSPPPVTGPNMFTDPQNGRADVYGGFNGNLFQLDTWQFTGTTWRQLHPPNSPTARAAAIAVFDHVTKNVVLFGGIADVNPYNTWVWDGISWTEQLPAQQPPLLYNAAAAFDSGARTLIVFGGGSGGVDLNDTWAWTGSNWVEGHATASPAPRELAGMANNDTIGSVVMFGGQNGSQFFGDTWELRPR
jgi:hypothetical protein